MKPGKNVFLFTLSEDLPPFEVSVLRIPMNNNSEFGFVRVKAVVTAIQNLPASTDLI